MKTTSMVVAGLAMLASGSSAAAAVPTAHHQLLLPSARENAGLTQVTLPLYQGTSKGRPVWFVITDASTPSAATAYRANFAPKLAVAANTSAAQPGTLVNGVLDFPGTVDFAPQREITAGPFGAGEVGLPVGMVKAGAVGDADYSPLIELPDGTVLNAAQVANDTGGADKASHLVKPTTPTGRGSVAIQETTGFFDHHTVHYISLDASVELAAVLENVTFAPKLAGAPGGDPAQENLGPSASSRAGIIAFTNGATGLSNPQRQGLNSTILDGPQGMTAVGGPVPLNIVQALPHGLDVTQYSPLWDAHLSRWEPTRRPLASRTRQTDFEDVQALAAQGDVTNPMGGPWGRSGPIPNCPVISTDGTGETVIQRVLIGLRRHVADAGRRVSLRLVSTDPVTEVTARVGHGSNTLAGGHRSSLDGRGTVVVKGSTRLRPGRYRVVLRAKDSLGQHVRTVTHVRLRPAS